MRKFLIRWWYTSNYEQANYRRMIQEWNRDDEVDGAVMHFYRYEAATVFGMPVN